MKQLMAHAILFINFRRTTDPMFYHALGYRCLGSIHACDGIFFGGSLLLEKDIGEDKKVHEDSCILWTMIFTNKSPSNLQNRQTKLNVARARSNHLWV